MMWHRQLAIIALISFIWFPGCKSVSKTQEGEAIGTAGGGIVGSVIGKASGNSAQGAIIGASVGGVTGGVIGHKMDTQAEELRKEVPKAKVARVEEGIEIEFSSKILFSTGRADLSAASEKNLNTLAKVLNRYPDTNIEIQGHSDDKGKEESNQAISEKRANAVAAYLRNNNVLPGRITTRGFGETAPKYSNDTEAGRMGNRRVEFLITANDKMKQEAMKEAEKKGQ